MKTQKIMNFVILVLGIAVTVIFLVACLHRSDFGAAAEKLMSYVMDQQEQVEYSDDDTGNILGNLLQGNMNKALNGLQEAYKGTFLYLKILYGAGFIVPALLAVVCIVLTWVLKARWRYLAGMGAALVGGLFFLADELLLIPLKICGTLKKNDILNWAVGDVKVQELSRIVARFLKKTSWVGLGLIFILAVICAVCYIIEGKRSGTVANKASDVPGPLLKPVICGIAGIYAGGRVGLQPEEEIILGTDAVMCNMILEGEAVSGRHCSVKFDKNRNRYLVLDTSETGTYTNENRKLKKGVEEVLPHNSLLVLGSDENIFMLE